MRHFREIVRQSRPRIPIVLLRFCREALWRILPTLVLAPLSIAAAGDFDPYGTTRDIPRTASSKIFEAMDGGANPCTFGAVSTPLGLFEAISRSLCQNPRTREAWADVQERAAQVGTGKAAYLPTLNASFQDQREYSSTKVRGQPELSTQDRAWIFNGGLSLGWLLYDFGQREATLDGARELFAAAQANLDRSLQDALIQAAGDYYDAQASQINLADAREIESNAKQSEQAAQGRVEKGVAPVSDQLEARMAYEQAALNRLRVQNDLTSRLGILAVDMGLDPDTRLTLTDTSGNAEPGAAFVQTAHQLIEVAKRDHPSVVAAEHQLAAALADERKARAQQYPSVGLIAKTSWSDQPTFPELGVNPVPASDRDSYIGVQVQIPLFDGFARRYQITQAQAQAEFQRGALDDAQQQVALNVWSSYQAVKSDTEIFSSVSVVLASAQSSFEVSRQRYIGGAGNILELLSAQTALANARQQRIQALASWRVARLRLAASLGQLDIWELLPDELNRATEK